MEEKKKKKQIAKISVFITSIFVIFMSITYAFINRTLTGTKKVTLTAGTLSLVLEEENAITISDALPMYDEVGMIQDDVFIFSLVNNTSISTDYTLRLKKVSTTNELSEDIVKYYLTKEGIGEPALLSALADGVVDKGTISGNDTIDYTLRLWIDSSVTSNEVISGKSLSYKIEVEASQAESVTYFGYNKNSPILETITTSDGSTTFYKISNAVVDYESMIGTKATAVFDDGSTMDIVVSDDTVTKYVVDENNYLLMLESYVVMVVGNIPVDNEWGFPPFSQGTWPIEFSWFESMGIVEFVSDMPLIEIETPTVTFAGVTREVRTAPTNMFAYTSEGCTKGESGSTCSGVPTNGLYSLQDDDGPSYYYRGNVNNLVKFGEYKEDYYIYSYSGEEYVDLESCQEVHPIDLCQNAERVLKHAKGTPMYWRIVRINGDKTIRMVYAGTETSIDDKGIGASFYNNNVGDRKYMGYTYDRTTNETDSYAKKILDNWYNTNFSGTNFENSIATTRYCSDTSDYTEFEITAEPFAGMRQGFFGSHIRAGIDKTLGEYQSENANPTFMCPPTSETYGGSYNLKIGLMTSDELITAGILNDTDNRNIYLFPDESNERGMYTMSPGIQVISTNGETVETMVSFGYDSGRHESFNIKNSYYLRPVINLKSNVVFKERTIGSIKSPYELAE